MRIKKAGGKVFGAVLTAAERKAMDMEINRQIVEADRRYADDIDGKVPYIMAAGKDFVKDEMSLAAAEQICFRGTQTASKLFPDFPICVDDKFYFAGTSTKPKSSKSKTPCEG